jgi:hypothetical protein
MVEELIDRFPINPVAAPAVGPPRRGIGDRMLALAVVQSALIQRRKRALPGLDLLESVVDDRGLTAYLTPGHPESLSG